MCQRTERSWAQFSIYRPSAPSSSEVLEELLRGGSFRVERMVSRGQRTPEGQWYDQQTDEWGLLLSGSAGLRPEDESRPLEMRPGDCINIPAHRWHCVEWTDPGIETVWLALHYQRRADENPTSERKP